MITKDFLRSIDKSTIPDVAATLDPADLERLVAWLSEKDDAVRYPSMLLLRQRSASTDDVFPYWDEFVGKLSNENSFQRSIGLTLLAENARWDAGARTEKMLPR